MSLKRNIGPIQLSILGVGTIVGAGIYSVLGATAGLAGPSLWVSFLAASAVALLTTLSYAELASMMPKAGAEHRYLEAAFPRARWLAFVVGTMIALNASATAATVSLAFGGYLRSFAPISEAVSALVLLGLCTALNLAGVRQATWVAIGLVCIEVGGLVAVVVAGLGWGEPASAMSAPGAGDVSGIFAATALAFFVYIGFEDVANLGDEVERPERALPVALLVSVVVTAIVYQLVVWGALSLVDAEALAASDAPLALAAGEAAPWLGSALGVAAMVATASTALLTLVSISRLLYGMARANAMPGPLGWELPGRKTPWVAALVLGGAACALLPLGGVKDTASVSALGILLVFIAIQAALIALRVREPERERPFRVPGAVGPVPILPVAGALSCAALCTRFEPTAYAVVGGVVAGMGALWAVTRSLGASDDTPRARSGGT